MIRPASLIRGTEPTTPRIEACVNNIHNDSLDCGIKALNCCNTPGCQKLGTSKLLLSILVFIAIFQGAAERYFFLSVKQASVDFNIHPILKDFLIAFNWIVQALFATVVAYWGNRIHRMSWLGGTIMFQGITSLFVIIPTISHTSEDVTTILTAPINILCTERTIEGLVEERPHYITTLVLLFLLQVAITFANITFYTLALSYLDDNVAEHQSPAMIGAAIAARFWGVQWGSAIFMGVSALSFGWWLGWTIIGPILFILGAIISLFPQKLLSSVVRQAAENIIETATNNSQLSLSPNKLLADISFFSSLRRILTNKLLIINILAIVLVQTGISNFFDYENKYLQARFNLPTYDRHDLNIDWTSLIIIRLLRPPLIAISILLAALIISKANPTPRKIVIWNIIVGTLAAIFFVVYIFIYCDDARIAGAYRNKLTKPFCARSCICDDNLGFFPVCPVDSAITYYSPCHAGCATRYDLNGIMIFSNCTCGPDSELVSSDITATVGACGYYNCQTSWIIFQVLMTFVATLLASGYIGKFMLILRSVLRQDKAIAVSLALSILGVIVYAPGKIGYKQISNSTCQYWSQDSNVCHFHGLFFGTLLNIVTASLIGLAIIFDIILLILVKDVVMYGDIPDESYGPIQLNNTRFSPTERQIERRTDQEESSSLIPQTVESNL